VQASSATAQPPAIVLGGVGAALSITRSLGRRGVPVHVLGDSRSSLAGASRYCHEFVDLGSDVDVVDRWLEWLRGAPKGAVVLPCGDDGLDLVAAHADELRDWGLFPLATAGEASLAMLDKEKTYAIAHEAGVPAPSTWRVSSLADLAAIDGELRYPCALKPLHSHLFSRYFGDRKLFVAEAREELAAALSSTDEHGLQMLVTEIIPGPDDRVWGFSTFIGEDGEPLFEVTKQKLRSYPVHFGVGTYHFVHWDPEVAEMGMRFLRGAGLRGMANVEFKRDTRDGSLRLIECNHRFMASNESLRRAGVDVPLVAYRQALGQPITIGDWRSVRLWMPGIDFKSAGEMRREGDLSWPRWIASLVRYPLYMHVFSFGDLGPSLLNMRRRVGRRLKALPSRG